VNNPEGWDESTSHEQVRTTGKFPAVSRTEAWSLSAQERLPVIVPSPGRRLPLGSRRDEHPC